MAEEIIFRDKAYNMPELEMGYQWQFNLEDISIIGDVGCFLKIGELCEKNNIDTSEHWARIAYAPIDINLADKGFGEVLRAIEECMGSYEEFLRTD